MTRADLFNTLAQRGPLALVSQAMRRDFTTVDVSDPLAAAAEKLQTGQARTMVVLRDGQLAGLLTLENVQRFAFIQAALEKNMNGDESKMMRTT